ncbi:MAG TPA: ABC transporter ATP-binding protein, partial [Tissierellaceae bacterium]|nr:ABC transporter ATP-binding protein [Tissierellaceae bacterium]
ITFIGRVINITEKGMASYKRLDEVFQEKPDIQSFYEDKSLTRVSGDIEFKGLNFSYPFSKNLALKNINLKIPEGTTLGIIGETASGKTTLVNLLLRLYKVDRGKITIGKRDINDYPVEVLRESIGYVPQDNILFTTTIRESIHFSRDIYTDEEIEEATKLSHIYENIVEFPRGFDTIVGERGVNLSGGQKQRISIARALIKDPKILILDDSLSAVDTKTEEGIINNLKEVLKDKTGIIIGHRISVVQDADHIIVMEEGEIVEEGSHDELLAKEGVYYDIYKSQFEEVAGELVTNEG